ncbi:ATP-binding protein [Candidatus Saccharibacteria bacterium]|nr:ATP-binding protein [Candidatus Saccharibacteria bacterium]
MKTILYIMCGLPYSGKTTYAKELASINHLELVSIDDIREKYGFHWGDKEANADEWKAIFKEVDDTIITSLRKGKSLIYDSTNHDRASRDRLRKLATSVGCESKTIFMNTPMEIIMRRRTDNQKNPTRSHIPEHLFNVTLESYEAPSSEEGEIIVIDKSE